MAYLIDGHNLIPKVGLRLDSPDDELELITLLQAFSRATRKAVEVFFDGAPAGQAGTRTLGRVRAHFIAVNSTADAAIARRLGALGKAARNWTVVSSDRQVRADAQAAHALVETSEEFAARLRGAIAGPPKPSKRADGGLTEAEVQRWLEIFKRT